jgi:FAD/FMN-containing dehydrogenase
VLNLTATAIPNRLFGSLREQLHGPLIEPGAADWDVERRLWNSMFDRRPLGIAKCVGNADVVAALRFARENDLPVSVRGGGHDAGGKSLLDDTFGIDVGLMNGVHVDAKRCRAVVGGGAKWRIVDRETQAHALGVTGGTVSDTGVAGLTLGGGIGWIMRRDGVTVDSLVAVTGVTADGQIIRASAEEEPELFWGMRGAGSNFAIVTSFEFDLKPLGPNVTAGMVIHPADNADEVIRHWADFMDSAPEAVGSMLLVMRAAEPLFPADVAGQPVIGFMVVHTGTPDEAEAELRPLREWGTPLVDAVDKVPYTVVQQMLEQTWPPDKRFYEKAGYLSSIEDGFIDEVIACFETAPFPSEGSVATPLISAMPMGGAVARVPDDAMAFPRENSAYWWDVAVMWNNAGDDPSFIDWCRAVYERLKAYASEGAYINLMVDDDPADDWLRSAYGETKYARLVDLKNRWDPDNVFRGNKNIKPTV